MGFRLSLSGRSAFAQQDRVVMPAMTAMISAIQEPPQTSAAGPGEVNRAPPVMAVRKRVAPGRQRAVRHPQQRDEVYRNTAGLNRTSKRDMTGAEWEPFRPSRSNSVGVSKR